MKRLLLVSLLAIGCSAKAQPTPTALSSTSAPARTTPGARSGDRVITGCSRSSRASMRPAMRSRWAAR